jgi:hypothetical protein
VIFANASAGYRVAISLSLALAFRKTSRVHPLLVYTSPSQALPTK